MMQIFEKLKNARKKLKLSQQDIENSIGFGQGDLSLLENGERKFIPNEYLIYLFKKGVDLNSIFNENANDIGFLLKETQIVYECKVCPVKDERISDLKDHIKILVAMIDDLKHRGNNAPG